MSTKYLTNWLKKLVGKVPLRWFLIIPFLVILLTTTGLIGWFSWRNGQQLVSEVAYQLGNELSIRIKKQLETALETVYSINTANVNAIRFDQLDLQDINSVEHHFWQQSQLVDSIGYIAFAHATGKFIGIERQPNDTFIIGEVNPSQGSDLYNYMTDEQGRRSDLLLVIKDYDPREQPWYKAAEQVNKAIWSPFYVRSTSDNIALGVVRPLYGVTGNLKGVLIVELSLLKITQFLNQIKIGRSGVSFIMERSGKLITSSTSEEPFRINPGRKEFRQIYAKNSSVPLIQAAAQHLFSRFGDLNEIDKLTNTQFDLEQQRQFLQITPLTDKYGINWLIVIAMPEKDFIPLIKQNIRLILFFITTGTITALLLSFFLTRWIIPPLHRLQRATLRLSRGEWDYPLSRERSDEIGNLLKLFKLMEKKLKISFKTLEQQADDCKHQLSKVQSHFTASQAHLLQAEKMALLGQKIGDIIHAIHVPLNAIKNNVEITQETFIATRELIGTYDQLINGLLSSEDEEIDKTYLHTQLKELAESNEKFYEEHTLQDIQTVFNKTLANIEKIAKFIVNLENFSRIEQVTITDIDLNECLDNILVIADNIFKYKITINKQYGNIPKIHGSPSQLNQVLLNLLTNAGQAIEYHGTIQIKTNMDKKFVHLVIQDNGKGIPKDILPKIFEPFFTTRPFGQGAGLGLSISHYIVQQHGGHIKVTSELGKGTKVIVSLPYHVSNKNTPYASSLTST